VLRWLLFAGLAVALGGLAGRAVAAWFRGGARDTLAGTAGGPLPAPWALRGALLGAVASAGLAALDLGDGGVAGGLETGTNSMPFMLTINQTEAPGPLHALDVAEQRWLTVGHTSLLGFAGACLVIGFLIFLG
jgi:hypothetical protein